MHRDANHLCVFRENPISGSNPIVQHTGKWILLRFRALVTKLGYNSGNKPVESVQTVWIKLTNYILLGKFWKKWMFQFLTYYHWMHDMYLITSSPQNKRHIFMISIKWSLEITLIDLELVLDRVDTAGGVGTVLRSEVSWREDPASWSSYFPPNKNMRVS